MVIMVMVKMVITITIIISRQNGYNGYRMVILWLIMVKLWLFGQKKFSRKLVFDEGKGIKILKNNQNDH